MMLSVTNLHKSFDEEVLKGIDLSIDKGEVVSIIGTSGSGKTTFLRCINLLEKPQQGTMTFDDATYDLTKITKKEIAAIRKKTAFVFQNFNLYANKTALENVILSPVIVSKMKKNDAVTLGKALLKKVGLEGKEDYYPSQLSGGQQQRVAIARALALKPEIIFFDEPTSALDPLLINEVLNVIKELAEEKMTMLIVTHEMNFARNVSNRVAFLDEGRILEIGSPEQIFDHPKNDKVKEFINSIGGKDEKN